MVELSAVEVVKNLTALARQLQILADELDVREVEAVQGKEGYTVAYARAYLSLTDRKMTVEMRRQQALLDTANERLAAEVGEAKLRAHKNQIATLKVRIDVGRSAAALVRAEADLFNTNNTRTSGR